MKRFVVFNRIIENENKDCKEDAYLKMKGMKLTSTRSEDNVILVHRVFISTIFSKPVFVTAPTA